MRSAFGFGIASTANSGEVLDVWFDSLGIGKLAENNDPDLSQFTGSDSIREVTKSKVSIEIDLDTPPKDVADAYLRLHLLSHRIVKPHGQSLEGIFGILNNVVWTSAGPCSVSTFSSVGPKLRAKHGTLTVLCMKGSLTSMPEL